MRTRIIDHEQLQNGYLLRVGEQVVWFAYEIVCDRADGTYVVVDRTPEEISAEAFRVVP